MMMERKELKRMARYKNRENGLDVERI